jgi:hypothetical protein
MLMILVFVNSMIFMLIILVMMWEKFLEGRIQGWQKPQFKGGIYIYMHET